jgi:hypothetical protein
MPDDECGRDERDPGIQVAYGPFDSTHDALPETIRSFTE